MCYSPYSYQNYKVKKLDSRIVHTPTMQCHQCNQYSGFHRCLHRLQLRRGWVGVGLYSNERWNLHQLFLSLDACTLILQKHHLHIEQGTHDLYMQIIDESTHYHQLKRSERWSSASADQQQCH